MIAQVVLIVKKLRKNLRIKMLGIQHDAARLSGDSFDLGFVELLRVVWENGKCDRKQDFQCLKFCTSETPAILAVRL